MRASLRPVVVLLVLFLVLSLGAPPVRSDQQDSSIMGPTRPEINRFSDPPPGDDESDDECDDDESAELGINRAVARLDALPAPLLSIEGTEICDEPRVFSGAVGGGLEELMVLGSGPTFIDVALTDAGPATAAVVVECPCTRSVIDVTLGTVGPQGPAGPPGSDATFTAQDCATGDVVTGIQDDGTLVCTGASAATACPCFSEAALLGEGSRWLVASGTIFSPALYQSATGAPPPPVLPFQIFGGAVGCQDDGVTTDLSNGWGFVFCAGAPPGSIGNCLLALEQDWGVHSQAHVRITDNGDSTATCSLAAIGQDHPGVLAVVTDLDAAAACRQHILTMAELLGVSCP